MTGTDVDILLDRLTAIHTAIDTAADTKAAALNHQTVVIAAATDRQTVVLRQIAETLERLREGSI